MEKVAYRYHKEEDHPLLADHECLFKLSAATFRT